MKTIQRLLFISNAVISSLIPRRMQCSSSLLSGIYKYSSSHLSTAFINLQSSSSKPASFWFPILHAQCSLGARHLALLAGDPAGGGLDGDGEGLEGALGAVVVVEAAEAVDVDGDAGGLGKAVDAVGDHLAAQVANLFALEAELDDGEGPVRQVDHGARQRLVQGRVGRSEARQARGRAQGLAKGVS